MGITEKIQNPIYNRINQWLIEHKCINVNVYEMNEKEAFYYAMQDKYPGVSRETTDEFFKTAQQLMG